MTDLMITATELLPRITNSGHVMQLRKAMKQAEEGDDTALQHRLADYLALYPAGDVPAVADTTPRGPKKLPHLPAMGAVNNAATDPPIAAAPGFHLSTCGNDSKQRARYAGQGWHLCKPGEGYVMDEGLCEQNDPSGYLVYNGDVVMAMNDEDYVEYRRRKALIASTATKKHVESQSREERAKAQQLRDEGVTYIPTEIELPHRVAPLDEEHTITI